MMRGQSCLNRCLMTKFGVSAIVLEFPAGEFVVRKGEVNGSMFVIMEESVQCGSVIHQHRNG